MAKTSSKIKVKLVNCFKPSAVKPWQGFLLISIG